jgi:hypothetical protein
MMHTVATPLSREIQNAGQLSSETAAANRDRQTIPLIGKPFWSVSRNHRKPCGDSI